MPELPEVQTVVNDLSRKIVGRKIIGVQTDWPKYFKFNKTEAEFKKHVIGKKITGVERRAKNILIHLSDNHLLLIHQKMTGHLLVGKYEKLSKKPTDGSWRSLWKPVPFSGAMVDNRNDFIHLVFDLDNGQQLALSDVRKFAKVICAPAQVITNLAEIKNLGPEPLDKNFNFEKFKTLFKNKKGTIKQVLMNPYFISGIGNIYSDEILYLSKIHPLSRVEKLKDAQLRQIYKNIKVVLYRALKVRGTSIDDFRDTQGKPGTYDKIRLVYQKEGEKCRHGHIIKRITIGARSAHFCPKEQKLYN